MRIYTYVYYTYYSNFVVWTEFRLYVWISVVLVEVRSNKR